MGSVPEVASQEYMAGAQRLEITGGGGERTQSSLREREGWQWRIFNYRVNSCIECLVKPLHTV